jgi:hypothetical protein
MFSFKRFALASTALLAWTSLASAQWLPLANQAPWPALKDSSSYTPGCERIGFPNNAGFSNTFGTGAVFCVSPNYATTNIRLLFSNFSILAGGQSSPEQPNTNSQTIQWATIFIAGTPYPVTFNGGQIGAKMQPGGFILSDPVRAPAIGGSLLSIPANTQYYIRSSQFSATLVYSQTGVFTPNTTFTGVGDGTEFTATQPNLRLSGTVPAYGNGSAFNSASMVIGTGWDGTPVYCVFGDSIGLGQADFDPTSPSIDGYINRGLLDAGSGVRNFQNFSIQGTYPEQQSSAEIPGQFLLRMRALHSLPNRPCNEIISEMGQNSPSIYGTSLLAFQNVELAWWAFLHAQFPDATIFQTTFPPHAAQINNDKWTVAGAAGQTTDFPTGIRWQASNWFRGLCPGTSGGITCPSGPALPSYVKTLDVTAAFMDPVNPGYWPVSGYSGTLASTVSSGVKVFSVNGSTAPTVGDMLALEPGTSNVDYLQMYSVTGSGPWTVSTTLNSSYAHSSGVAVGIGYTSDGTHPTTTLHKAAAVLIEAYKTSAFLP